MQFSYRKVSIFAAGLCFALFMCLLLVPEVIYGVFGIIGNNSSDLMSRRAAMLFLGLSLITFRSRDAPQSDLLTSLCFGFGVMMAALALICIFEFIRGAVGVGIWLAIITEAAFAGAYFTMWRRDQKIASS